MPILTPVDQWVGSQLDHDNLLKNYTCGPPKGELIRDIPGHPLIFLGAHPRIIVPKAVREAITIHTHEDIHHQNHQKVTHILKPLYYWPGMDRDVEQFVAGCETCRRATIRRRHLKMIFDPDAPSARALPRQHYGLDFYGVHKGDLGTPRIKVPTQSSRDTIEARYPEHEFFQNRQCARTHVRRG